jgi:hypothetical protein
MAPHPVLVLQLFFKELGDRQIKIVLGVLSVAILLIGISQQYKKMI